MREIDPHRELNPPLLPYDQLHEDIVKLLQEKYSRYDIYDGIVMLSYVTTNIICQLAPDFGDAINIHQIMCQASGNTLNEHYATKDLK